ncbi:RNA-guided endonuclease TnpB family protein [Enterocloster clostridioformis]|uniref:RNA-guided endonuclease TnpB family protein n=1 Tax=Enterocloster clostridioformis TaxID=1531 RepID=UPI0002D1669E|nr:RNA-guided endonuclease TnpB family protein [Enterocloster clostridioformis]ENZ71570.1 IS605 OrfB family transposase [[Clostridium] clostridioforme 90A4]
MEQLTITAKIQVLTDTDSKSLLDNTMSAYSSACNYVADYIFRTHDLKQFSLNKALYSSLRELFGLKSQMAQSVLKTVIARYKTILENQNEWIKPNFKHPEYDLVWNRDYSLTNNCFSVNTLKGRIKLPYFSKGMEQYFSSDIYKFGTAKLVNKHGKYFLHIPVTYEVEESNLSNICNVVGIDRGINFIVATYDNKHKSGFVSGKQVKQKRANYSKLRKKLQMRQTPSSRRRLKAIGSRENRWMQDINHQVSKALVQNNPKHTLFVLEDLSGVRNSTEKIRLKDRYVSVSWSFYDLEQKLIYKSKQNQSTVIKVNPAYTSQTCPCCGHIEKTNRNKKLHLFTCKNCGYKSNDDRIGAMNLYRMGINYLEDSQVPNTVTVE